MPCGTKYALMSLLIIVIPQLLSRAMRDAVRSAWPMANGASCGIVRP
jgi:hypothetical protein